MHGVKERVHVKEQTTGLLITSEALLQRVLF